MVTIAITEVVSKVDEVLNAVFQRADAAGFGTQPTQRFKLYVPLLRGFGSYCPGFEDVEVEQNIEDIVGGRVAAEVMEASRELRTLLPLLAMPTYAATSYWSPIDLLRHTVVHRGFPEKPERRLVLANAYLFYALTFQAADQELFSLIQFLALRAARKAGVRTWFMECEPPADEKWWQIPRSIHGSLLGSLGLETIARQLAESAEDIESVLRLALANEVGRQWWDRGEIASAAMKTLEKGLDTVSTEVARTAQHSAAFLTAAFETEVAPRQAIFMLATHLLWREACPSECMYTFPVHVGKTCCVMTVGTMTPLSSTSQVALGSIAKSLFIRPLLLDYASKEAGTQADRRTAIFRHLLNHNLPKLLIYPATTELSRMGHALARPGKQAADLLDKSIARLRVLFGHYESFLTTILVPRALERDLEAAPRDALIASTFETDVRPMVELAFDFMRTRVLDSRLRDLLHLEVDAPSPVTFKGHSKTYIVELLFNLLSNAVDALVPADIHSDPTRAVVTLRAYTVGNAVHLEVADRGPGFTPLRLQFYRACVRRLEEVGKEEFWRSVQDLLEAGVADFAREEHMGVGLIFCALYLRSLEWQVLVQRAGKMTIDSVPGSGTRITLVMPVAEEEAL